MFSKTNRKHVLRVSIELYKHEWKFGRTRNAVGTRAEGECFQSFFEFSQTFTSVCITHRSIETRSTCFLFLLENNATRERKTTCYSTITAEIHARSLVNFYCPYADRHMNFKFIRRVSERERVIRQFVVVKNKLMSVFNASVLLLTMNFAITLSK